MGSADGTEYSVRNRVDGRRRGVQWSWWICLDQAQVQPIACDAPRCRRRVLDLHGRGTDHDLIAIDGHGLAERGSVRCSAGALDGLELAPGHRLILALEDVDVVCLCPDDEP